MPDASTGVSAASAAHSSSTGSGLDETANASSVGEVLRVLPWAISGVIALYGLRLFYALKDKGKGKR